GASGMHDRHPGRWVGRRRWSKPCVNSISNATYVGNTHLAARACTALSPQPGRKARCKHTRLNGLLRSPIGVDALKILPTENARIVPVGKGDANGIASDKLSTYRRKRSALACTAGQNGERIGLHLLA